MTADIELLPLPAEDYIDDEGLWEKRRGPYSHEQMENYARTNVAHATAAKDAEIEALRAEVTEWKRVASAQAELHGEAEARAERLEEALRHQRWCLTCGEDGWHDCEEGRAAIIDLLRDYDRGGE